MQIDKAIATLKLHKELLTSAQDFEAYKKAHIGYVDFLIGHYEAERVEQKATEAWLKVVDEAERQELINVLWDKFCPGIRQTERDREVYGEALDALLERFGAERGGRK
jgi:hypothetical protein